MPPVGIGSIPGLLALLSIVPLIILYLIRPKPKVLEIPSLMFMLKSTGRSKLTSFFKQITKDWLFLVQLLILLLLALSVAKPFTEYMHDITAANTVIVMDVSGSMHAKEGARTRFAKGVSRAKTLLGTRNTIILAKSVPSIGLQDGSANDAIEYLNSLRPKETNSRIGDAIILAGEAIKGEGRVIVVSDFVNTAGQDPNIAKSVLESKGIVVDFVNIADNTAKNVGIVGLEPGESSTTVYVRNFDGQQRDVQLKIGGTIKEMTLPAGGAETFTFVTPEGITKMELLPKDDFNVDNVAYLSAPVKSTTKALLVTNNASVFLANALRASGDITVDVAKPPVVPTKDYKMFILHKINPTEVLPGTYNEIADAVKDGASAVIHAQRDILNYQGLLPMKLLGITEGGVFPQVLALNRFTKNIEFGKVGFYHSVEHTDSMIDVVVADSQPLVSVGKLGDGKIAYYGILEEASDFPFSPGYPIFWTEFLRFMTGIKDIKTLNYRTKDTVILDEVQTIKGPARTLKQATIIVEDQGLYELADRTLAANMIDEAESDLNSKVEVGAKSVDFELKPVKEKRKYEFELPFVILATIIIMLELLYVKMRGDV